MTPRCFQNTVGFIWYNKTYNAITVPWNKRYVYRNDCFVQLTPAAVCWVLHGVALRSSLGWRIIIVLWSRVVRRQITPLDIITHPSELRLLYCNNTSQSSESHNLADVWTKQTTTNTDSTAGVGSSAAPSCAGD